jgi:hypothetical protein
MDITASFILMINLFHCKLLNIAMGQNVKVILEQKLNHSVLSYVVLFNVITQ